MIILFYMIIISVLGVTIITRRPYFLTFLLLLLLFSLVLIALPPEKEKSHSKTLSVAQQHHKACGCCRHQNLKPSQRKIELVVPNDSSVDAQVTFGNNTVNLINL